MAVRYNPVKGPSLPGSDLKEKKVNEREKARAQSYQSGKAPAKPKNTGKGRGAVKTASSSASFSPVQGTTQHLDQIRKRTTGGQTVKQTFVPDNTREEIINAREARRSVQYRAEAAERNKRNATPAYSEDATEAAMHYENAIRGQYGHLSSSELGKVLDSINRNMEGSNEIARRRYAVRYRIIQKLRGEKEAEERQKYDDTIRREFVGLTPQELRVKGGEFERAAMTAERKDISNGYLNKSKALFRIAKQMEKEERDAQEFFSEKPAKTLDERESLRSENYKASQVERKYGLDRETSRLSDVLRIIEENERIINHPKTTAEEARVLFADNQILEKLAGANGVYRTGDRGKQDAIYQSLTYQNDFGAKSKLVNSNEQNKWYRYINDIDGVRTADSADGDMRYDEFFMNEHERAIYNYIYQTKGVKNANLYLDHIRPQLSERATNRDVELATAKAIENPRTASVETVLKTPVRAVSGIVDFASDINSMSVDMNAKTKRLAHIANATKETVASGLKTDAGRFFYNAGMSSAENMVEFATATLLTGGNPAAAKAVMSIMVAGDVAQNTVIAAKERGLSDQQALALGFASAAVEAATERIPLDVIMSEPKSVILGMAKSFLSEGIEEGVSAGANMAIDYMVTGSDSEISAKIQEFKDKGYGDKHSAALAIAWSIAPEMLAGGISGAGMSAIYQGFGSGTSYIAGKISESRNGKRPAGQNGAQVPPDVKNPAAGTQQDSGKVTFEDVVNSGKGDGEPDVVFSIAQNEKGKYVKADRRVIKGNDPVQWAEQIKDYIDKEIRKGEDVQFVAEDGDVLTITEDTSGKARFRNIVTYKNGYERPYTDEEYARKLRAEAHIDELSVVSKRGKKNVPDKKDHPFAKDGFNYRTAYFEDFDGQYYRITMSVGLNGEVKTVYNVGKIKEAQSPSGSKAAQTMPVHGAIASKNIISQNEQKGNTNFWENVSIGTDEDGNDVLNSVGTKLDEKYESPENAVVLSEARGVFEKLGFTVTTEAHISDMPEGTDGYVDFTNKEVYINPNAENAQEVVIKHELLHILEWSSGSRYVVAVKKAIMAKMPKQWEKKYQENWEKYEKLSKSKPELAPTEKRITSETIADFAMYFSKDDVIRHYAQNAENRTFVQAVKDFLRYIALKISVNFGKRSADVFEECAKKWELALAETMRKDSGNVHDSVENAGSVMYSKGKSFAEQVAETLSGEVVDGNMVYVCETPMLLKKLGLHNKPMLITRGHLRDMHHEKHKDITKYHGLSEPVIDRLPDIISHPAIVFDSIWEDHPNNVYILSEVTDDDGYPLLVAITPDGKGKYNNVRIEINSVNTMFGKDNPQGVLDKLGERPDKVLYMNTERTQELLKARGRYLPTGLSNLRFDSIIHQSRNIVKQKKSTNLDDVSLMVSDSGDGAASERSAEEILKSLDDVARLLRDPSISDEEYRRLDRISRNLERELAIALAKKQLTVLPFSRQDTRLEMARRDEQERFEAYKAERIEEEGASPKSIDKIKEAVDEYRESGDSSKIPKRQTVERTQEYYIWKIEDTTQELNELNAEIRRGRISPLDMEAAVLRRDSLMMKLRNLVGNTNVMRDVLSILDEIDTDARPNHTWVRDIAPNLVDKKNVLKDGTYGFNDFERNLQHFFGKYFNIAKEKILKPLYDSKKAYADYLEKYSNRIYEEVVKGLGIKQGSAMSAAVQWLGEKQRPHDKNLQKKRQSLDGVVYEEYTYEMCVEEFGEEKAEKIKKAADIFRECYDEILEDVNRTRRKIYPNNPDKQVPRRENYFRHFQKKDGTLKALWNIITNIVGIAPELVGVSEGTKPRTKFAEFMQKRSGNRTVYDAVGGFLDYLPQAAYATHIDPNIVNIRSLAYDLAMAKAKQGANGNPDANSFIRYLQNYANKLAGKTVSHLDRAVHDSTVGRSLTAAVGWFNNRAKANAVLGNFSSMLSQFANILNIIGSIKNEADVFAGAWDACLGLFDKGDVRDNYEESGFLKERFIGKKLDRFERYGLTRLAADALGIADEIGTRITWCAAYREAQRLGVDDMVAYADSLTRKCVAGRGIGEVPLNFESTVAKLFLPFRLEVNNNINVYRDILFDNTNKKGKHTKAYATRKILELFVASALLNAVMAALKSDEFNPLEDLFGEDEEGEERDVLDRLRDLGVDYADGIGDGVVFDPIAAIASGVHQGLTEDKDAGAWKKAGLAMLRPLQNVTGDYLSNDPLAATAIGAMGVDSDAISKLFNNSLYVSPGTGAPVFSSLAKSIGYATDGKWASAGAEALKTFALPFGGSQVDKSVRGIFEATTGASTTEQPYERMVSDKDGVLKYLIEPNAENWAKSVLFGPTAFSGASDAFYNSDGKKLTEEETKEVLKLPDYESRKTLFDELIAGKEYRDKDEKQKQMDEAANAYKESVKGDSIVYQMYQDGYKNASPFLQVYLDMSMTVDGTKYEVKLTADEGTAANEALTDVLSERFRELDGSERFRALPKEERESHIDKIRDLEHKRIKTEFLHEKGIIPDDLYVEMTFDYEKSRANQDRKLFVDDAQSFVESNAQVSAEQYLTYVGEGRATDEVVRQVRKYTEYASHRAPTEVDVELMELSNRLQVENPKRYDLNVYGNASGLINFTKKGVEYYIDMPAEHTYELMAMTDDACRAELSKLFKTKGYTDATDEEKADMISKVKSKVRAGIKDKLKAKYKSVKVDDFDKILAMGGAK